MVEITALTKPVFYQDAVHTLFVEPDVTERTVEQVEWAPQPPPPPPHFHDPGWWKDLVVIPKVPLPGPIPEPGDPWLTGVHPGSLVQPQPGRDWLTNPSTAVMFDGVLVGAEGKLGAEVRAGGAKAGDTLVAVHPGSGLAAGAVVVADTTGLSAGAVGGLSVIGGGGLNAALAQRLVGR